MGKTIAEKIFSQRSGRDVRAGDIVIAGVDFAMMHDVNAPATIAYFESLGSELQMPKEKVSLVLDHFSPCPTTIAANTHRKLREFAETHQLRLFQPGDGICHQLVIENAFIRPGSINSGTDSHTCSYGAFNALGIGIGATEMAVVLAAGSCWFKVPDTVLVEICGKLPDHVTSKDIALHLIKQVTEKGAIYKNFEFCGDGISGLSIDSRVTLCNMVVEMGAKSAVMPGDAKLAAWLQERGITDFHFVASDPDAAYYSIVRLDVSGLKPQIAISPNIDDVVDVDEIAGKKIDQVVIGSCTNGRLEDFAAAANVLRGKHVAPGVRLILGPASRSVYHQMITSGIMESLLASGAVINPPGCGPCAGLHGGLIGDGEAVLSTTNRNMRGRMGSSKSDIYLCSPVTAAFSALKGSITGPYDEQGV